MQKMRARDSLHLMKCIGFVSEEEASDGVLQGWRSM